MKYDIIICGVGGQGTLAIANVIGEAAVRAGLYLKQAEVHGMSQRGGSVQSHLRLSDEQIFSDLIPYGKADLILSMEPMEALRYVKYLSSEGAIVSSKTPFVNINDYPSIDKILAELQAFKQVELVDADALNQDTPKRRSLNMVLMGVAAKHMRFFTQEIFHEAIATVFESKGPEVVESNVNSFDYGYETLQ